MTSLQRNLELHRAPRHVWDRPGWNGANGSAAWGAFALLALGSGLLCWALLARRLQRGVAIDDALVHDASADSFPASDPPSWTSTAGARPLVDS